MKHSIFLILIILANSAPLTAQTTTHSLQAINTIWADFCQSFETLDVEPFKRIHSKRLVRVGGGKRISNYRSYMTKTKERFENAKQQGTSYKIALRFFERTANATQASERGVYKMTVYQKDKEPKDYYGQFHVIHTKEKGKWKILVDYDSNEGKTIGAEQFNKAVAIDNLLPFLENVKSD